MCLTRNVCSVCCCRVMVASAGFILGWQSCCKFCTQNGGFSLKPLHHDSNPATEMCNREQLASLVHHMHSCRSWIKLETEGLRKVRRPRKTLSHGLDTISGGGAAVTVSHPLSPYGMVIKQFEIPT